MATERDYYEILNVERTASGDVIKRSYRKMAMKYHPDRNAGDASAEEKFKECAEAYEVLSDADKRSRYDQFGHAGLKGQAGHDFSHMNAGDIFSMFDEIFGGGGGRRGRQQRGGPARGYDLETQTEITLEDAFAGTEVDIEFTRQDRCDACGGNGGKPGTQPTACTGCGGQGQVEQAGLGGMFRMMAPCPHCKGAGKTFSEKCSDCHGSGRTAKKRKLAIQVPAGIEDGQAIRVSGEGEPGAGGGPHGDLHVVVRVEEHELFQRENNHLILKLPISFAQAALGAKLTLPTLDGETEITVKPGTQHGELHRIAGRGMPALRGGRRGELVVALMLEIPKKLSDRQGELLREYAALDDRDVLPENESFWSKIKSYIS
ncbi:MAG: molecular chaperone DnaJ [Algisphaera sp.]